MTPLKLLVYAPSGHGKTTLLASAVSVPEFNPVLFLSFESGILSVESKCNHIEFDQIPEPPPSGKMNVVKIEAWEDFDVILDWLAGPDNFYKTVLIDSLSELNYLNLTTVTAEAIKADPGKHMPDISQREDYLRSQVLMRRMIRRFRDLSIHTIFSASSLDAEDAKSRRQQARPALIGKLIGEVPGILDIVGYLAVDEEGHRFLLTQPSERFMAKDRSEGGKLGGEVPDPTISIIWALLNS